MSNKVLGIIIEYLLNTYGLKNIDANQSLVKLTNDYLIDLIELSNYIAHELNLDNYDADCIQSVLYQDVFDDSLIQIADHIDRILE